MNVERRSWTITCPGPRVEGGLGFVSNVMPARFVSVARHTGFGAAPASSKPPPSETTSTSWVPTTADARAERSDRGRAARDADDDHERWPRPAAQARQDTLVAMSRRTCACACAVVAISVTTAACGGGAGSGERGVTALDRRGDGVSAVGGTNAARLARDEDALLHQLAAVDARIAKRAHIAPSEAELRKTAVGAILHEDTSAKLVEGALDVFSFDARARGIDGARRDLASWSYPVDGDAALERDLVARLVAEEDARLAEERDLPRSASTLVRGMVESWAAPADADAAKDRDAWVTRRLDELRATLRDGALTMFEANELDDELDALEKLTAAGYPSSAAALTRLRLAAGDVKPAKEPLGRPDVVRAGAKVHLGLVADAQTVAELERVEGELRAAIKEATAGKTEAQVRALEQAAADGVLVEASCAESPERPSRMRALAPPPERAAACGAVRLAAASVASGATPDDAVRALMSLHGDVVVALWATAIHFGPDAPYHAARRWRPVMTLPDAREVRLLRVAAVRPVAAIAAGWAVVMMEKDGARGIGERGRAWSAFGDAPLDVVVAQAPATTRGETTVAR